MRWSEARRRSSSVRSKPPTRWWRCRRKAFALSKRQTRQPALDRMQAADVDAAIEQIWTAPETLARVSRTMSGAHVCASGAHARSAVCFSGRSQSLLENRRMISSLSSSPIERRTDRRGPAPAWILLRVGEVGGWGGRGRDE